MPKQKIFNWSAEKNQLLMHERGISFERIVFEIASGNELAVAVALKNPDGRAIGVLVSAIDLVAFSKRFLSGQPASDAVFLMWDRAGNLLFRYPDAEKISGKQFANLALVKQATEAAALGSGGTVEMPGFDGVPRVIGFAALDEFSNTGLYIGFSRPVSAVYAPAELQFRNTVTGVLLMLLFGAAVAWIVGRNMIWRPAKVLTQAAHRMAQGDFSARVGAPYGRNEMGELARMFDQMAQASESGRNTILEANRALAQRVAERTASLEISGQKFRSVLESAADGFVISDAQGRIAIVNAKAEALFGYTRVELIGQSIDMLVPDHVREMHPTHRQAFSATPAARGMGERGAVKALRKDGSEFFAGVSLSTVNTGGGYLGDSGGARHHGSHQCRKRAQAAEPHPARAVAMQRRAGACAR